MSAQLELPSDIEGLTRATPVSRRSFFMSASAATAAGYTLAAGPVRADAIHTDTKGVDTGDAKGAGNRRRHAGLLRTASGAQRPPIVLVCMEIFGLHEFIKD